MKKMTKINFMNLTSLSVYCVANLSATYLICKVKDYVIKVTHKLIIDAILAISLL